MAVAGYATYGSNVAHDVLMSYPASPIVSGCRVLVALLVTLSYPLQSHPARTCALSLASAITQRRVRRGSQTREAEGRHDEDDVRARRPSAELPPGLLPPPPLSESRHAPALATTGFLVASAAAAVALDDLGLVLSLVGATGSVIVSYLLPGVCYYQLSAQPRSLMRHSALGLTITGLCIMPISLTLVLMRS